MRRPAVLIAFIMAVAILVTDSITGYTSDYLEGLEGNNAAVTGRVVSIVKKDDEYFKLQLSDVSIISDNGARSYKILVNVYSDIADYRTVLWDSLHDRGGFHTKREK